MTGRNRQLVGAPSLMSLVLLLLLHSGWLGSVNVVFVVVEATRHTFVAKNAKPLIGPISAPFGFNENGHVKIEITDFVKDWSQSAKENLPPNVDAATLLAKSEAGFLFQRFPNEAAFNQYMDTLRSNASLCAFQHFRQNENNNDFSPYYSNEEGEDPSSEQSRRSDDASYSYGGGGEDDVFPGWGGGDDYDYRYRGGGDSYGIDSATDGLFVSMNYDFGGDEIPSLNYRFQAGEEGLYFLIFQVCPMDSNIVSSFKLEFHYDNKDSVNNTSHLSAGQMKLPLVFFYFACSYLVCFGIWYSNIRLIQSGKPGHFSAEGERPVIFHIHQLMTVLIVLKFFSLFFESIRYYWLQKYGEALVWSFFYYSVTFVKGIFLFTVILLIGTGWSFVKPFLNAREMKIVLVIFVLQVANNVAIFVLSQETEGESSYKAWTGVLHIVDIICCCAVLIPIVWQVNEMEKNAGITDYEGDEIHPSKATQENGTSGASHDEDNDDNKDDALSKLKLFRTFYLIVMGYVYTTRIVIYLFASFLDYRHAWLQEFIIELTTLAFYVMVGILFRPVPASPAYQRVRIDLNDVTDDSTLNEVELQPTNAYKTH